MKSLCFESNIHTQCVVQEPKYIKTNPTRIKKQAGINILSTSQLWKSHHSCLCPVEKRSQGHECHTSKELPTAQTDLET